MSADEERLECERSVDAAPYVLGALGEREHFAEHVATCATCRAEVATLRSAVEMLPASVAPTPAPEALRRRILATVRSEAALLRAAGPEADEPSKGAPRRRRRLGSLPAAWIAVAASIVAVAAIALNLASGGHDRVITGDVASTVPGAHAYLHESGRRSELVVSGMPQPASGKIYEVWLAHGAGAPQPTDALFGVTSSGGGSVDVPSSLHGVREVLVTSERLGGSSHPTSAPVIRVRLPA